MSKESEQFNALAAERFIEDSHNEVHLLLTEKAEIFACWHCGEDTLHERTSKGWRCIYHYNHDKKAGG